MYQTRLGFMELENTLDQILCGQMRGRILYIYIFINNIDMHQSHRVKSIKLSRGT